MDIHLQCSFNGALRNDCSLGDILASELRGPRPEFNVLCDNCLVDFPPTDEWAWVIEGFRNIEHGVTIRRSSIRQLVDSAQNGCHLCSVLLNAFTSTEILVDSTDGNHFERRNYQLAALPDVLGWILRITLELPNLTSGHMKDLLLRPLHQPSNTAVECGQSFWLRTDPRSATLDIMALQPRPGCNVSQSAIRQIKTWLDTCTHDHVECRRLGLVSNGTTETPFRLIFVGAANDNAIVRLVETRHMGGDFKYVTLSHRWTEETEKIQLIKERHAAFIRGMSFRDWPLTFQDTVLIAHQLGIQYIWIDSLCIIQKSEDWGTQSQLMHEIYANAELNLAAVEAPTKTPGLRVHRNPLAVAPCVLSCKSPALDLSPQQFLCWRPDDFRHHVDGSALYKRGWTLQERLLSKRTIHFSDQLYWECPSLRASETFPSGTDFPDHFVDDFVQKAKIELRSKVYGEQSEDFASGLHGIWCSIVRYYSSTDLTFSSDRLVAIRGVVNCLTARYVLLKSDYLAGLWKPCLQEQLLWGRDQDCTHQGNPEEPHEYRAPSWSWASCSGRARFTQITRPGDDFRLYLIKVLSASVVENVAGQVSDGSIFMRCKLVTLDLDAGFVRRLQGLYEFKGRLCHGNSTYIESTENVVHIELDKPSTSSTSDAVLLPIFIGLLDGVTEGLVVVPVENASSTSKIYRRLGIFRCRTLWSSGVDSKAVVECELDRNEAIQIV